MEFSDANRFLGVFSLRSDHGKGKGGAARQGRSVTYWFAVRQEPDRFDLHALGPNFLPTPVKVSADRQQFLADYVTEPAVYTREVLPRLRRRLTDLGLYPDPGLDEVRNGQPHLAALGLAADGPEQTLSLLESLRDVLSREPEDAVLSHCGAIVGMAIDQRKLSLLDEAMETYRKALDLSPNDDHLHFNMARTLVELGDWQNALAHARKALDLNPDLVHARKLVAYVNRKEAKA